MRERFMLLNIRSMTVRFRYSRSHFALRLGMTPITRKLSSGFSHRPGTGQ